jgi:hypothetical protein
MLRRTRDRVVEKGWTVAYDNAIDWSRDRRAAS